MSGPAGLDFSVFQHDIARQQLPDEEYDDLMAALHVIEQAALEAIHSRN